MINIIYFALYIYSNDKVLLITDRWAIVLTPFGDKRWFLGQPLSASCLLCTGRLMHLYAVCVDCLEGVHKIICIKCKSRWDGSWHQLGTMYTYDILAASPCCQVGIYPSERVVGAIRLLSPDECRGVRGSTVLCWRRWEGVENMLQEWAAMRLPRVQQWWLICCSTVLLLLEY